MFTDDLISGRVYKIRLTDGTWVNAMFQEQQTFYTYEAGKRAYKRYTFTNTATKRRITIKSRVRIKAL